MHTSYMIGYKVNGVKPADAKSTMVMNGHGCIQDNESVSIMISMNGHERRTM